MGKKFKIKNYYARTLLRRKAIVTNAKVLKEGGEIAPQSQIKTQ